MNDQPQMEPASHPMPDPPRNYFDYKPSERLGFALDDAEVLLKFAAAEGTTISPDVVGPLVDARMKYGHSDFTKIDLMAFFSALTTLSSLLRPVTANSIRACESEDTKRKLQKDRGLAVALTVITLAFSAIAFINHSLSSRIDQDVISANQLAVALRVGISPNPSDAADPCRARQSPSSQPTALDGDKLTKLQGFAALSREIYKQSLKFNIFVLKWEDDPIKEASADLEINPAVINYQAEVFCKISLYERARDFSRNVVLDNGYVYGAISQYILPVLYALVGAYAFRLRSFSETVRNYTYHPSFADSARMIGAFIVGSVISLFNLFTEGLSLSPLAVAFLAGYAVEVFFSFLDTLVQTFTKKDGSVPAKSRMDTVRSGA